VVYCAIDREFAQPVFENFSRQTGIRVDAKYDTESTKSVALAEQLLRERRRPRADLFWNNEILHTIRLARAGLFRPSPPTIEKGGLPATPDMLWWEATARGRVLLVNTQLVPGDDIPRRLEQLTDPRWKGRIGLAKPLFGTTATHMAALAATLGQEKFEDWFGRLRANGLRILSGNKQVAVDVGSGSLALGLTDTDDAMAELLAGRPVQIVYLDTAPGEYGTLLVPSTIALIQGSPHPEAAERLLAFLISAAGQDLLNNERAAHIPLSQDRPARWEPSPSQSMPRMKVDFHQAADRWNDVRTYLEREMAAP
jgi:iron(III) transport system substrate-binding protein